MDNKVYYTHENNFRNGPFSASEVLLMYSKSGPNPVFLVWSEGMSDWSPVANCITELKVAAGKEVLRGAQVSQRPTPSPIKPKHCSDSSHTRFLTLGSIKLLLQKKGFVTALSIVVVVLFSLFYWARIAGRDVSGKVLIVQRNGDAKKLALVKVEFVSIGDGAKWFQTASADMDRHISQADVYLLDTSKKLESASKKLAEVNALYGEKAESLKSVFHNALLAYYNDRNSKIKDSSQEAKVRSYANIIGGPDSEVEDYIAACDWFHVATSIRKNGGDKLANLATIAASKELEAVDRVALDQEIFYKTFSRLSASIMYTFPDSINRAAVANTDGDGSFAVSLPPGDYFVVATASREIGGRTERFRWALRYSVGLTAKNVLVLSNSNEESLDPQGVWSPGVTNRVNLVLVKSAKLASAAELDKDERPGPLIRSFIWSDQGLKIY